MAGAETDPGAVVRAVTGLQPWGWATIGAFALVPTPAVALITTALEYRMVGDTRTVAAALSVLGVLAAGLLVALTR
jgi:energy-converting hydrogenase Eha subunit A